MREYQHGFQEGSIIRKSEKEKGSVLAADRQSAMNDARAAVEHPDQTKGVRTHCELAKNLETSEALRDSHRLSHVSVVVAPDSQLGAAELESLLNKVRSDLEPKCLLTTRLHVVGPYYVWVSLGAVIYLQAHISAKEVREGAVLALRRYFFSPLPGERPEREGWPFGRYIYLSEIIDILERVPGVKYVEHVHVLQLATSEAFLRDDRAALGIQIGIHSTIGVDSRLGAEPAIGKDRLLRNDSGQLVAIALRPYELVRVVIREEAICLNHSAGFTKTSEDF